jgi:hypothetical protein
VRNNSGYSNSFGKKYSMKLSSQELGWLIVKTHYFGPESVDTMTSLASGAILRNRFGEARFGRSIDLNVQMNEAARPNSIEH